METYVIIYFYKKMTMKVHNTSSNIQARKAEINLK